MSPPPPPSWRGRPDDDPFFPSRRARKRHRGRKRHKRRAGAIGVVLLLVIVIALAAGGLGGAVAVRSSCDLKTLQPVEIGANTFVYSRTGSLLGSIPAERNREPVARSQISPWMARATVARAIQGLIWVRGTGSRLRSAGIGPSSEPSRA